MDDYEIRQKVLKSKKYANESNRFKLLKLKTEMDSRHGNRIVSFNSDSHRWECTCDFYKARGTCSHIMALQQIMYDIFPKSDLGEVIRD